MKAILWNVDTQYDFMRDDGEYHGKLVVAQAHLIEPRLAELTLLGKKYSLKVVNTADDHDYSTAEISANPDYRETFPEHCMRGTLGAEYVPATRPENPLVIDWRDAAIDEAALVDYRNLVIKKDAFDVFRGKPWSPHAEMMLDAVKPEIAVVYGVATNVCVDYAVKGLLDRHVRVFVPIDAIKELPEELSGVKLEAILESWREYKAGATLIRTKDIEPMIRELYGVK